ALHDRADGAIVQRPVCQRGNRGPQPSDHGWAGDQLIAERNTPLFPQFRSRTRVDLRDLHVLGADLGADPAPRAVVDGGIGRRSGASIALRLGTDVLGSREQWRGLGNRTVRLADRAFDAVIERIADEIVHRTAPETACDCGARMASAAAYPVTTLIPVPDFSLHGTAPPRIAPTACRFVYTGRPVPSMGRRRS